LFRPSSCPCRSSYPAAAWLLLAVPALPQAEQREQGQASQLAAVPAELLACPLVGQSASQLVEQLEQELASQLAAELLAWRSVEQLA
jgi:hypothetical protein